MPLQRRKSHGGEKLYQVCMEIPKLLEKCFRDVSDLLEICFDPKNQAEQPKFSCFFKNRSGLKGKCTKKPMKIN